VLTNGGKMSRPDKLHLSDFSVVKNSEGNCARCGASLGFYDTKWIRKTPPHEICCSDGFRLCGTKDVPNQDDWLYYTDG
jgi:hypothetical protein